MKKVLLALVSICVWSICVLAQVTRPSGVPEPVPTKPGTPCTAYLFIQAHDTGVNSVCNSMTLLWNDINVAAAGAGAWGTITGTLSSQTDLQTALDLKVNATRTVAGHALSADVTVSKSDVGLGNVDNTADTAKPVSTAQQTALNLKANIAAPTFTTSVTSPVYISASADPADAGVIRLGNNELIEWEKATPGTDWTLGINASDQLVTTAPLVIGSGGAITSSGAGGALGTAAFTAASAYEVPLTFSTGLNRTTNTITVSLGTTTCTNQFVSAISAAGAGTCTTVTLAGAQFANQGTTTTVLHGNGSGNPSFGAVALGTDVSGTLAAAQFPALTGDITTSAGALATSLKSTGTAGTYRSVTFDAQGRETSGTNPTTFSGYGLSDTSANFRATLTDENGSGVDLFDNSTSATFNTPIIAGGLTASGSGANTFAGSSGTFVTSTGANTVSGAATFNSTITLGGTALSFGALPSGATTAGTLGTYSAQTYTVTGTNTATAFQAIYHGPPTFTDASAGTATDLFAENWVAPVAAGSLTATRKHTLGLLDSTSAASSITGGLVVSATYGTTATSVGIGGGNVNAGGLITGGTITSTGAFTASSTITQTSNSATAFESGPNGGTNPVLRLVNNTASQATGLSITGAATGTQITLTALDSGSNTSIFVTPKGTGAVVIPGGSLSNMGLSFGANDGQNGIYKVASGVGFLSGGNLLMFLNSGTGNVLASSSFGFCFANGSPNGTADVCIGRNAAGVLEVNNSTVGTFAPIKVSTATASGSIINTGITADTAHTDTSVCQDTTSHQFYSGTGTLGVCLGTSTLKAKEHIFALRPGLSEVMRLSPISFTYKPGYGFDTAKTFYGLGAETVAPILPQLVPLGADGKPRSVDLVGMVPVLINAIQEMQKEIEVLKARP